MTPSSTANKTRDELPPYCLFTPATFVKASEVVVDKEKARHAVRLSPCAFLFVLLIGRRNHTYNGTFQAPSSTIHLPPPPLVIDQAHILRSVPVCFCLEST